MSSPPSPQTRLYHWIPPLISGGLLALAFPCHPQHPLAFLYHGSWACVALVPLLMSLPGGTFKAGFQHGWLTGFVFNLLSLYWVAHTQGGGAAVVGGTFLMAAYLGLFIGVFAGIQNLLQGLWGRRAAAAVPLLWTAQEYLLSLGELGFPWLLLGHSQAIFPALIQYATFTGVYGISCWIALLNVLILLVLTGAQSRLRLAALGLLILSLVAPYLHGRALIPTTAAEDAKTIRVGLIQPNLSRHEKWGADGLERSFTTLETLSRQAAEQKPALLVWPETALPCYLRLRPNCRSRVEKLVEELQIPLLTGASDYDHTRSEPYNSAFFFRPHQPGLQSYAKMHLVPFGERTPFRDNIPLVRDIDWKVLTGDLGPAEFGRGTEHTIFAHPQAAFATLICFESAFPDLVRKSVDAGAQLLVNITNDSWFGQTAGPYQHAQLSILRAVENRMAIARCATSGISVFIDPFGRTFQATDIFEPAMRVHELPVGQGHTFYTRHGDIFAQFTLLAALGLTCVALFRSSKKKP
jgi:apolipoprotein N-acyltransferase